MPPLVLALVPWLMVALAVAAIVAVVWLICVQRDTVSAILLKIDSRGWLAIGSWLLVVFSLALLAFVPELRKDDLFKMIIQALILSGFINMVMAFYFTASKREAPKPPPDRPAE